MIKDRQPDWQDTNVNLIGSDIDKKCREAAANGEPQWTGCGEKAGLQVWRIEQFRVVPWPKSKYGRFHIGDSYIVLNTYVKDPANPNKLSYDAHFWIGSESTQDEYGTAAYKTVELDDYLKGDAVQHREVENHESAKFLEYFKGGAIQYLKGGVATGFKKVEAEVRPTRLLRVKGRAGNIAVTEVACKRDAMNSGDVFILDCEGGGAPRNFGATRRAIRRNSLTRHPPLRSLPVERQGVEPLRDFEGVGVCNVDPAGAQDHRAHRGRRRGRPEVEGRPVLGPPPRRAADAGDQGGRHQGAVRRKGREGRGR